MVALHFTFASDWHRFTQSFGNGTAELLLKFGEELIPSRLKPATTVMQSHLYFSVDPEDPENPEEGELELEDTSVGVSSFPATLQPKAETCARLRQCSALS